MIFQEKETVDVDKFWKDYEASTGEKVLAKSLCQYLGGWNENKEPLWGLAIVTSGGFRFLHFPYKGWLTFLSKERQPPKEESFFIPKNTIKSVQFKLENRWWKKILIPASPKLIIHCIIEDAQRVVIIETDKSAKYLVEALQPDYPGMG